MPDTSSFTQLAIPARGDLTHEWVEQQLVPLLVATENLHQLHEWHARIAARRTYQEQHEVKSVEAARALALIDLRMGELLGDGEHGSAGARNLRARGLDVVRERDRPELRKLAANHDVVLPAINNATKPEQLSRRRLLAVAERADLPAPSPRPHGDALQAVTDAYDLSDTEAVEFALRVVAALIGHPDCARCVDRVAEA